MSYKIVLGIGTSHTPMLTLDAAEWKHRATADYGNEKLNLSDGRWLSYAELGTALVPSISRRLDRGGSGTSIAKVSTFFALLGGGAVTLAVIQESAAMFLVLMRMGQFCILGSGNYVLASMQVLAPNRLRATFVASALLVWSNRRGDVCTPPRRS